MKEGLDEEEEKWKGVEEENARSWRWLRSTFSGCQASHTAASQPRGKVTVSTPPPLDDQDGDEESMHLKMHNAIIQDLIQDA